MQLFVQYNKSYTWRSLGWDGHAKGSGQPGQPVLLSRLTLTPPLPNQPRGRAWFGLHSVLELSELMWKSQKSSHRKIWGV